MAGLPSLLASYDRVITLLTKNFAHGAGFEPTMGLLRQINSLDRSANYGNPYFCGSGRIRTYSALRQQIYSLSRLSNCGADPFAPNTLFYNYPRESNSLLRKRYGTCTWCGYVINHIFLTMQIYKLYFIFQRTFLRAVRDSNPRLFG